ncbi:hypothetical protein EV401DRAFT_1990184 [Pisolithus croceorrhizus]|nr:hypothetical protein EV401DRAFT_1990184 [Pisolithus croceorrhizus]
MEASLFDRLSREVSQFCDNSTVASGPPEDMKPQQISAQGLTRPSFSDNDASVTSVSGFTQESSEGVVQHINGNNSSAVSVTSTSKIPASSRRPSTSLPSSLRTRSASIRSEAVSKPSNESSRLVAERLLPPDTCLEISDDTDAITGCSDPFIPNGVENQSSKSEPFSSIPTGSSNTEAPQLPATVDHSARPHVVPLPNPKSDLSPITSTLSRTRANSDGTVVPVGDTSQKMNVVDMAILEIEKMTASLPMSSPAIPGVGAEPTARCPPKSDHPPSGVPTVGRISSPLCQSSLQRTRSDSGRNIPPVSASGDNTDVRAETSSTNSAPTLTATSLSMGRLTTATNSVEGISKESMGSDNPSSVSPPALHAASDMVPGSPVTQEPTLPVSSMPTSTVTEQATREQIRRQFLPLIRLLVADRHRGIFHSSRSDIARELQVDDDAYKRVGATRFKPYAALAQRAGLVVLGGDERRRGDNTWIALHPDWFSEAEKTEFQSNAEIGCDSRAVGENLTSTSGEIGVGCRCV